MDMRLVIPPENPDLDGAASAFSYARFLKQKEEKATAAKFGDLEDRTEEIFEEQDESLSDATYYLYSADEFTLVSASSMENVSTRISEEKVTEVIDHREDALEDFTEAEHIIDEEVSSASAIIAEMFREDEEVEIEQETAQILLEAVKEAEETEKDTEIREWLEEQK